MVSGRLIAEGAQKHTEGSVQRNRQRLRHFDGGKGGERVEKELVGNQEQCKLGGGSAGL